MLETTEEAILNLANLINHEDVFQVVADGLLLPRAESQAKLGLELAGPINWHITVSNTGGEDDFIVEGKISGTAIMECRRCLEPSESKTKTEFVYQMEYQHGKEGLSFSEAEEIEDILIFGNPSVNFADLIIELFLMSLPLTTVCKADCKGLNSEGINLNLHPEAADDKNLELEQKDSPFASLKDFKV